MITIKVSWHYSRSMKMPFINCKLFVLDTKVYVPVVTLLAKVNQKLSKLLRKGFERTVHWNEYKIRSEIKDTTNEYRHFLNQIL